VVLVSAILDACLCLPSTLSSGLNSAGKPPSAFPQDRLHIDFSQEVTIGRQLAAVVDGLLEPLVEDRLTPSEALDMLTDGNQQSQSTAVKDNRLLQCLLHHVKQSTILTKTSVDHSAEKCCKA